MKPWSTSRRMPCPMDKVMAAVTTSASKASSAWRRPRSPDHRTDDPESLQRPGRQSGRESPQGLTPLELRANPAPAPGFSLCAPASTAGKDLAHDRHHTRTAPNALTTCASCGASPRSRTANPSISRRTG
ncbi:hypothetical protein WR25_21604 [Diploscapter pachys]|uniref:Uncharacterized protein n=1 Tax=Diploscapter pachys TaxID=2018661 RepID=A0A2A2KHE7_9BILA|nr:hypothetical protein WR25_21604 [Diploscapter pachys]